MADLHPVAGAKFYIGGVKDTQSSDFSASDFTSETWTEVDGWETAGQVGDTSALINVQLINRKRDQKLKGTRNAGSMENNFAIIVGDAGQAKLIEAADEIDNYAFRIVYDDAPSGGSPTTEYFVGLVMSAPRQNGGANTVRMLSATVEINSNVVTVGAAA